MTKFAFPTLLEMRARCTSAEMIALVAELFVAASMCAAHHEPPAPEMVVDLACARDDHHFPDDVRDRAADLLAAVLHLN